MGGSVTMRAALLFWTLVGAMSTWQPQLAAAPAPQNGIEGRWTAEQSADSGPAKDVTLSFERRGVSLGGSWQAGTDEMPLFDVREAGGNITFTLVIPGTPYVSIRYTGARTGDEIRLTGSDERQTAYTLTAHRASPPASAVAAGPALATPAPATPSQPAQIASAQSPADIPALRPSQAIPPAPPAVAPRPAAPIATASGFLDGDWTAEQSSPGSAAPIQARISFAGSRGTMHVGADDWPLFDVHDAGDMVAFTLVIPGTPYVTIRYSGMRAGDQIQLASLDEGQGTFRMMARRADVTSPPATSAAPTPAEPRVALLNPPPAPPAPMPAPMPRVEMPPPPPEPMPPAAAPQLPPPPIAATQAGPLAKLPLPPLRDVPPNNLARIPLMGWASRGKLGTDIDDDAIRQAAESLEETGLRNAGYTYVEVDEGWQGVRDANGVLHPNAKFPDMKALGDYSHSKQLKFGLQISAAPKSCGGFAGSYGHEAEDAKLFASWGVDYIVADWCGAESLYPTQPEQQAAYQKIGEALRASGRQIAFGISQGGAFDVASWGAKTGANLWRMGPDIKDNWESVTQAGFAQTGKEIYSGPGRTNDPGLIQVGNGGMTPDEYRTQLNLWAVLAAPMMLGNEVRIMTKDTVALLTNPEVIAIDQDASARQAKRVAQNGQTEVWARTLADGSIALGLFNRGAQSAPVAVSWEQLGITGAWRARDLWWHENVGTANGSYVVFLTGHTSLLLRLSK